MSEKWINYRAIYRTALLLQELSGVLRLSYAPLERCWNTDRKNVQYVNKNPLFC